MSVTDGDIERVYELFDDVGGLSHRKMMGGASFYCNGQIFAILSAEGRVFLKASGPFADELAAEGAEKFEMEDGRGMNYWTLPDAALDDPELACDWARRGLAAL
ncbi:TfoX/Sxy family protein [Maritimibacter dapengensis]|uniref:TfoX/Sxy family protein n=1 Tax=Maritimibacter dapengensis TaxID=2836868 RepID=A0ABS6T4C9_9RHOB|nr:TfoX/Sxy family protein [Maritimibacter dapengensis]MBV7379563.1 TfoX/Sxy family protein [Maritimibacter dapengensis]